MITIEKAIELLTDRSRPKHQYYDQRELPAIKLGIEAMKGWETIRETAWFQSAMKDFSVSYLLPGETK